ncbi:hypothetical protein NLJ89_g11351 [Agrocybe chaxingu]|uniref:Uncharacterized protein n=1 Tax=Agrocybe chaxingu TaxID=84603 RepID=A0A9W8MQ31_9AGAR|nr:hypothetical protein NLJ89_g11351 [Agrocybe chaxingu]
MDRDAEAKRQEQEAKRQEQVRKEQARRQEQDARRQSNNSPALDFQDIDDIDPKIREEQAYLWQQAQYRKKAEDIARRVEERRRNDSFGNDGGWAAPGTSPGVSRSPPQFNSPASASSPWGASGSPWSASSKPTTIPSPSTARSSNGVPLPNGKPRNGSVSSGTYPAGASPHAVPPISEADWARRHAEFTNEQQEKFRREQEKIEAERQLRSAGKPLGREDIQRVFEHHEKQWARLPALPELTWADFPWPMMKPPQTPDDISAILITAYFQSPLWPEKDKGKTPKDRIKDHMKRWHPDRFESKTLPRVVEAEKEKVKQGAGNVARHLNDLLRKENEGSGNNLFGD